MILVCPKARGNANRRDVAGGMRQAAARFYPDRDHPAGIGIRVGFATARPSRFIHRNFSYFSVRDITSLGWQSYPRFPHYSGTTRLLVLPERVAKPKPRRGR